MIKKLGIIITLVLFVLTGCSSEPTTITQHECLEEGLYKYDGDCVQWDEIPEEDWEDVLNEIADEVAETNGVTREEALLMMNEMINSVVGDGDE